MKFAGRTESRGARFLHGSPAAARPRYGSVHPLERIGFSGAVGILIFVCFVVALFRHTLGAAPTSAFWPIFGTLPIVTMRLAHRAALDAAFWMAGGVFFFGVLWYFAAQFIGRRSLDAFLVALLAFQLFYVARYGGDLLPLAGPLSFGALTLPQKLNLFLQLALLAVVFFWVTRPAYTSGYETSAPSRVTGFLKKRRLPSRIGGIILCAIAVLITIWTARLAFGENANTTGIVASLRPPVIFIIWVALDGLYFIGRTLWQRVH